MTKKDEDGLGDELRRGETHLPCRLTELDVEEKSEELVKLTQDRVDREIGLDHWKADKKEEQKALEGEVSSIAGKLARLARVLREREEERPVEVVFYINGGQVTMVRTDTGEVVTTRVATPGELQMPLPGAAPEGKRDA